MRIGIKCINGLNSNSIPNSVQRGRNRNHVRNWLSVHSVPIPFQRALTRCSLINDNQNKCESNRNWNWLNTRERVQTDHLRYRLGSYRRWVARRVGGGLSPWKRRQPPAESLAPVHTREMVSVMRAEAGRGQGACRPCQCVWRPRPRPTKGLRSSIRPANLGNVFFSLSLSFFEVVLIFSF